MNKIFLILALSTLSVFASAQSKKRATGDVNGDGKVNIVDVTVLVDQIAKNKFEYVVLYDGVIPTEDPTPNDPGEQSVTGDASDITNTTATLTCYANNILDNLSSDLKVGVIYTASGTPNKSNGTQKTISTSSIGEDGKYTLGLTGLTAATTYYYRSFVYQSGIWFYGKVKSFTTTGGASFSASPSNITCFSTKITARMNLSESVDYKKLNYGVCYGTEPDPTTKQSASNVDANGQYSTILRALTGNTTYYYRPYAVIDGTTFYGTTASFKTIADNVVTTGTADADGNVNSKLTIGGGAYSSLKLGLCWSKTNAEPTTSDGYTTTNEVDDENCFNLQIANGLYGTIYYRAYVLIDGVAHYGAVKSVVLKYDTSKDTKEYVDLGLSVKWATCNVGAESPEEYGDYFAWGETTPKSDYSWSTYSLCNGSYSTMTKYCKSSSYGTVDSKTTLELTDDAARVNWGGSWRMPTYAEQTELRENCYWEWTTSYDNSGVKGYIVYKVKNDSDKGKKNNTSSSSQTPTASYSLSDTHIFLPASGYRDGSSFGNVGSVGYYWSGSLYTDYSFYACRLYFNSGYVDWNNDYRYCGFAVRPVCP